MNDSISQMGLTETQTSPVSFNVDRNARPKDYAHLAENEILVSSIFWTFQGEGPFAGYPAIFIRLAGCNFGAKNPMCTFCDTDFRLDNAKKMTFGEALGSMTEALLAGTGYSDIRHLRPDKAIIVVTGGEPSVQPNLGGFLKYLLRNTQFPVQLETNGTFTRFLYEVESDVVRDRMFYVVSPKAGPFGYSRVSSGWKEYLEGPFGHDFIQRISLKFVVTADPEDVHYTVPDVQAMGLKEGVKTYVSPMAVYRRAYQGEVSSAWDRTLIDAEKTEKNYQYAARLCTTYLYLLSIQKHLFTASP